MGPLDIRERLDPALRNCIRQWLALVERELSLLRANRFGMGCALGLPILIGVCLRTAICKKSDSELLAFLAVVALIWMGMSHAALAIVGERPILRRESHVGLSQLAYLGSKLCVVALIAAIQAGLLTAVIRYLPITASSKNASLNFANDPWEVLLLAGVLALCGAAGGCMGLLVSAVSANKEVANALVPLIVIIQLLFSAQIAESGEANHSDIYTATFQWSTDSSSRVAARLSYGTISRWGDMALRHRVTTPDSGLLGWAAEVAAWLPQLLAMIIAPLILAWAVLLTKVHARRFART